MTYPMTLTPHSRRGRRAPACHLTSTSAGNSSASLVVAALVDHGAHGRWAEDVIASNQVAAPHLMPAEVASTLRRLVTTGALAPEIAAIAHADLLAMPVVLMPYLPVADRIWALRQNVTPYDAWYVALAEALDADLATVDVRLTSAPGPRCRFITP